MNKVARLSEMITEDHIVFFAAGTPKQKILATLIATMHVPNPSDALAAVEAREAAGSTVIAPGLAVPHARLPGITQIQAALGFVKEPEASPGSQPKIWLLFIGPAGNMKEHLAFLAGISSLFQTEDIIPTLQTLPTAREVLKRIKAAEEVF